MLASIALRAPSSVGQGLGARIADECLGPVGTSRAAMQHGAHGGQPARSDRALAANFPVVRGLLGEERFADMAREFLAARRGACRPKRGDRFALFLGKRRSLRRYPYLGDVTRVEWALTVATQALEAPRIAADAARRIAPQRVADLVFVLHPSCRLVASRFAILDVCRAHRDSLLVLRDIAPAKGGERLLVLKDRDWTVTWHRLSRAQFAVTRSLRAGHRFASLCEDLQCRPSGFDPWAWLAELFAVGAIAQAARY